MVCSCCECDSAVDRQFTATKAAKELQAYRQGRVEPTARLLRDSVVEAGLNRGSLLDIGGGIGALTFELLERGMSDAVIADAAAAWVTAATDEANRRGSPVHVVLGDFLQVSGTLPSGLDRRALDELIARFGTNRASVTHGGKCHDAMRACGSAAHHCRDAGGCTGTG